MTVVRNGIQPNLLTGSSGDTARLRVDVSQTGFWEGREFRISVPLSIPSSTPTVLKFVAPIDFILQSQGLTCDEHGILFQAYRSTQGAEGGSFSTAIPIYANNFQSTAPVYAHQATITTGGTFTPDGGQQSVETIRLKTSGSTAQAVTVGGSVRGERGLAAGAYYLKFSNLTGSGTAQGVYSLIFEERP
jgi:hypothetical protein